MVEVTRWWKKDKKLVDIVSTMAYTDGTLAASQFDVPLMFNVLRWNDLRFADQQRIQAWLEALDYGFDHDESI